MITEGLKTNSRMTERETKDVRIGGYESFSRSSLASDGKEEVNDVHLKIQ